MTGKLRQFAKETKGVRGLLYAQKYLKVKQFLV